MADQRSELVDWWNKYHADAKIMIVESPKATPKPVTAPKPKPAPKVAHILGVDVSSYNNPDFGALKRGGLSFVSSQVTDGRGFADGNFGTNWEASRSHGMAFGAYHFLRSTSAIDDQLDNIARHIVDKRIPVSIDCEPAASSAPKLFHVKQFIERAPKHGIRLGFLYLPHWYWMNLGRPNLRGLLPLWQSSYGRNPVGSAASVYAKAGGDRAAAGWTAQGGVTPTLFQFGSQIHVPGYGGGLDADAFRGSVQQLIATRRFI